MGESQIPGSRPRRVYVRNVNWDLESFDKFSFFGRGVGKFAFKMQRDYVLGVQMRGTGPQAREGLVSLCVL